MQYFSGSEPDSRWTHDYHVVRTARLFVWNHHGMGRKWAPHRHLRVAVCAAPAVALAVLQPHLRRVEHSETVQALILDVLQYLGL